MSVATHPRPGAGGGRQIRPTRPESQDRQGIEINESIIGGHVIGGDVHGDVSSRIPGPEPRREEPTSSWHQHPLLLAVSALAVAATLVGLGIALAQLH